MQLRRVLSGIAANVVNAFFRLAYRIAYRLALVYWFVRRPNSHGALVVLWYRDRCLLIRNSYHSYWALPGGGVRPTETPKEAALRELREEIGLVISADTLRHVTQTTRLWAHKRDTVDLFDAVLASEPTLLLDGREVVEARFVEPSMLVHFKAIPHIGDYFAAR